jgi:heme A synthase
MFLRIMIVLQTLALFAAPITAGILLTSPSQTALHSASAYAVFTLSLVQVIAAILAWKPGGGSPRPILYAAVFFVLVLAQIALGIAGAKIVHVPLGVLMFGVSLLQLSREPAGRRMQAAAA